MEILLSWCRSRKSSDPMYLCIEAGLLTRLIISGALQGSATLDFADGITHRMSPSPETIHWSRVLRCAKAGTVRKTALLF